jgi:Fur family ferric uptake transcriptional regulator
MGLEAMAQAAMALAGTNEVPTFEDVEFSRAVVVPATVYRTLHLLKEIGMVTEVAIGDRLHYELTDPNGHHHHMVCRACRGAFNLSPHYLEEFRRVLDQEFGFEPDLEHFAISGLCSQCRSKPA